MEFHIARQEGMKDIEGEKDFQEETFDSTAFVLVDMVCMPVAYQLVEGVVFYIPTLVS
jgi:hypothetical protein